MGQLRTFPFHARSLGTFRDRVTNAPAILRRTLHGTRGGGPETVYFDVLIRKERKSLPGNGKKVLDRIFPSMWNNSVLRAANEIRRNKFC